MKKAINRVLKFCNKYHATLWQARPSPLCHLVTLSHTCPTPRCRELFEWPQLKKEHSIAQRYFKKTSTRTENKVRQFFLQTIFFWTCLLSVLKNDKIKCFLNIKNSQIFFQLQTLCLFLFVYWHSEIDVLFCRHKRYKVIVFFSPNISFIWSFHLNA